MDGLIALLIGLACAVEPPAAAPPAPTPAPEPTVPTTPAVFELTDADTGYVLRLREDGAWTEAWPTVPEAPRSTYEPLPPLPDAGARRATATRAAWAPLVAGLDGQTIGPLLEPGARLPGGGVVELHDLTVSVDGHQVRVRGDLRAPESFGPLAQAWAATSAEVYGPQR